MLYKRFERKGKAVCSVLMHKIVFQADNRFVERVLDEDCSAAVGCFS